MHFFLNTDDLIIGCIIFPGILATVMFTMIYRHFLDMRWRDAVRLAFAAVVIAGFWLWSTRGEVVLSSHLFGEGGFGGSPHDYLLPAIIGFYTALMCGAGILAKVYRAVVLHRANDAERAGGATGFRAWFGPANLVMGALVVTGVYTGMGWPMWETAALVAAVLAIYPAGATLLREDRGDVMDAQHANAERQRVLAMVDAGKISGEDAAELIGALAQSRPTVAGLAERSGLSGNWRIMMLGAIVLLVGFCLPLEKVNVSEVTRDFNSALFAPTAPNFEGNHPKVVLPSGFVVNLPDAPQGSTVDLEISVRGGDIHYGIGWILMGLGAAAAMLPLIWPARGQRRQMRDGIVLAVLVAGSILLLYVASEVATAGAAVRIEPGLLLMVGGFAVMWAGALREYLGRGFSPRRVAMAG